MVKVLLADDNAQVRQSVLAVLRQEMPEATFGEAIDGADALRWAQAEPWDVVVLDVYMPGESGLQTLRALRRLCPGVPVLMFSMYASQEYVSESLKAGAAGYVLKELAPGELVQALRAVLAGGTYLSETLRPLASPPPAPDPHPPAADG